MPPIREKYVIEKLHMGHTQLDFNCDDPEVNSYFFNRSYDDVESNNSQVYVFLKGNEMIGFYAISTKSVRFKLNEGDKEYSWPVLLVGQLGVNKHLQGVGWGPLIMEKAFKKGSSISKEVGCKGLVVETYKQKLIDEKFYEKLGFKQIRFDNGRFTYYRPFPTGS